MTDTQTTRKSVLVVEDDPIARSGMGFILKRAGYVPVLAQDGGVALDHLRTHPPDLMLLDMMLPVRDGWAILDELRKEKLHVPVVIVTGLGISSPDWARSLGAAGLVSKPVEPSVLLAEVERCLAAAP